MFKGTYRYRIDGKGRLPVPAAFRRVLDAGSALVVTPLDDCLAAFPPGQWQRLESQLRALPTFSRSVKALTRLLASRALDCALDVQGRILLPPELRSHAGLGREAVVVGVLDRFEIWQPDVWERFVRDSERLLDDVSLDLPWPVPTSPAPLAAPTSPLPSEAPLGASAPEPDSGTSGAASKATPQPTRRTPSRTIRPQAKPKR